MRLFGSKKADAAHIGESPHATTAEASSEAVAGGLPAAPPVVGAEKTPAAEAGDPMAALDPTLSKLAQQIDEIEKVLDPGDDVRGVDERVLVVEVPLSVALDMLPERVSFGGGAADIADKPIRISVTDPYEQMKRGKVLVDVADIAHDIPDSLLAADFRDHLGEKVEVPLSLVVNAVPPEELTSRSARGDASEQLEGVPDVFLGARAKPGASAYVPGPDRPAAPSAPAAVTAAPRREEAVEGAAAVPESPVDPAPAPVEPPPVAAAPDPVAPPPEPESEPEPQPAPAPVEQAASSEAPEAHPVAEKPVPIDAEAVVVRDVDVNSASAAELARAFPGVGPVLAQRIVEGRPYACALDLGGVEGMSRRLFHRITGQTLPGRGSDTEAVKRVLALEDGKPIDLRDVADRIAALPGISGCILTHEDGYLLASAWDGRETQSLGAIVPQIFKNMEKYFALLSMDGPGALTIFAEPRPIFITRCGAVFLMVFVPRGRSSIRRFEFLEALAGELVRRMRGNRGEADPGLVTAPETRST